MTQPTAALLVGLIVTTVAAGCIMVVPLPPFGTQRGAEEIESLQVGVSTRDEASTGQL